MYRSFVVKWRFRNTRCHMWCFKLVDVAVCFVLGCYCVFFYISKSLTTRLPDSRTSQPIKPTHKWVPPSVPYLLEDLYQPTLWFDNNLSIYGGDTRMTDNPCQSVFFGLEINDPCFLFLTDMSDFVIPNV